MSESLELLKSMDASLKQLVKLLSATAPKPVADDRELDSKYGDPEVRFLPRDWTGQDFKGCHFSECPAELLDMLASTFDYFADQADAKDERTDKGKPVAEYKRRDAARARGWAARVRAGRGKAPQPPAETGWAKGQESTPAANPDGVWGDEVPF